ncbi:perilipin-3-like isoform X2 [Rana temporaria]|uniref:perilipin-3-like isoform X2 n=1 Tax=Rana temporaria TaxID=8407 RepID=UPI001AAD463F|nr:perilipin-3-like isoform X2 [Rana temporaria]
MASNGTDTADQPEQNIEQQNLVERVANIPLVSSACSMVSGVYTSTKDSHPYIRSVCDVAEMGAKTLTGAAVTGSKPIISRLEPQIATANELACKGLDRLESSLPILQQPADKVASDAKSLVTGARDAVVGAVTGTVTGARDTVTSAVSGAVSGVMGLATGAIQGSISATRSAVSTVMESQVGQFVTSSVDSVLGRTEEWVDHYLPMTDEELSQLAATVEGFEVAPLQQQKDQQSYYVRLGSLSSRIRHRAYQHSLGKVESFNQSVQGGKEKLNQLWVDWSKRQPETGASAAGENVCEDQALDSRVLSMTQMMTKQLQTTCFTLISGAQGLPANVQERMQNLRQNVQELHTSFSSVRSLGDLSAGILAQSRAKATQVHDHVNELFSYVMANTPLTWVVGPFAPQIVERPETPEDLKE